MPTNTLKALADKAGVDIGTAEKKWNAAKEIADKNQNVKKDSNQYWALVTYITKKELGIKESFSESIKPFLNIK
nr:MAG TPA: Lactose operon repressor [Caudoviricetes sp.]